MAKSLEKQLKKKSEERDEILGKIAEKNGKKRIACNSCRKSHQIRTLTLIQTHWYTPPQGCSGGDYWNSGEVNFICPETGVRNRLLFNNDDIDWRDREKYEFSPELQFKSNYKPLFKQVLDEYEEPQNRKGPWVNNYYVDHHRKKFGLVERK